MIKERNNTKTKIEKPAVRRLGLNVWAALSANKATAAAMALLFSAGLPALADPGNDNRAPEVPVEIAVPVGNKVHFHAFGVGVQIYTWNGTTWGGPVPEATLFHADAVVAIHFAGPSWESNSGSIVVGLPEKAVIVDTNAIPWVRLSAKIAEAPGIFADTTFIQRVNTTGGKAPSVNGAFVGQVARVHYTADYFFYREAND